MNNVHRKPDVKLEVVLYDPSPLNDYYIAHCINYDLTSRGATAREAMENLKQLIAGQITGHTIISSESMKSFDPNYSTVPFSLDESQHLGTELFEIDSVAPAL